MNYTANTTTVDDSFRRLAAAVVVTALRDIRDGDTSAETWLLESDQCQMIMQSLDLGELELRPVVESVKRGRVPLTLRGIAQMDYVK